MSMQYIIVIIMTIIIITQFLNTRNSMFNIKHKKTRKIYELKA